jgi:hypothetical protein
MSKSNEEKLKEVLKKHSLIKWGCYKNFVLKLQTHWKQEITNSLFYLKSYKQV